MAEAGETMDTRFPVWMYLRLESINSIERNISTIRRLFAATDPNRLRKRVFSSDKSLEMYLKRRAQTNMNLRAFVVNNSKDDDEEVTSDIGDADDGTEIVNLPVDDAVAADQSPGHATVTLEIRAVGYYAEFLGRMHMGSDRFIGRMEQITKYVQQADVSMDIQDNVTTLLMFDDIIGKLHARQEHINARISRWLKLGNLAEAEASLKRFAATELQPYIELCLRYLFMPMAPGRLRKLRMTLEPIPSNVNELYDLSAQTLMVAKDTETVDDMIFVDGDHLTHVSMVYAAGNRTKTKGRLVTRPIGQTLSVYIYFLFRHCKGNFNSDAHRKKKKGSSHPLFSQGTGGVWTKLTEHVRVYGQAIELPVEDMGLTGPTSSYMHQSRVAWVASRARVLDSRQVAADARAVGMGFGQEHKFYPGLASLRQVQRARVRLSGGERLEEEEKGAVVRTQILLEPVVEELYPLLLELQNNSPGCNPDFRVGDIVAYSDNWNTVVKDPNKNLYSKEILACFTKSQQTIEQFLIAENNKSGKRNVDEKAEADKPPPRNAPKPRRFRNDP